MFFFSFEEKIRTYLVKACTYSQNLWKKSEMRKHTKKLECLRHHLDNLLQLSAIDRRRMLGEIMPFKNLQRGKWHCYKQRCSIYPKLKVYFNYLFLKEELYVGQGNCEVEEVEADVQKDEPRIPEEENTHDNPITHTVVLSAMF